LQENQIFFATAELLAIVACLTKTTARAGLPCQENPDLLPMQHAAKNKTTFTKIEFVLGSSERLPVSDQLAP